MHIITRLKRLVRADAHALVDQLEQPQLLLRQALRDMQAEIERAQDAIRSLTSRLESLAHKVSQEKNMLAKFDNEITSCLAMEKHDMARIFVRRKIESQKRLEFLTSDIDILREKRKDSEHLLQKNMEKYEDLKRQSELILQNTAFVEQRPEEHNCPKQPTLSPAHFNHRLLEVREEDVEIELLRARQKFDDARTGGKAE